MDNDFVCRHEAELDAKRGDGIRKRSKSGDVLLRMSLIAIIAAFSVSALMPQAESVVVAASP